MKRHVMMRSVMVGAGLVLILGAQGCASKKWVRGQLAPVEQRVNNLEGQASSLDGRLTALDGKVTSRAAVVDGQQQAKSMEQPDH